jgi:hypothetical protein
MAVSVVGASAISEAYYGNDGVLWALGILVSFAGVGLLFLLLIGFVGSQYLSFEPQGFRVGDKWGSVLFTWENIRSVLPGEFESNQAITLWVRDVQALAATAQGNEERWGSETILKNVARAQKWLGHDWMIMTGNYGLNATLLARAIATYVTDPSVRATLEEQLKLMDKTS